MNTNRQYYSSNCNLVLEGLSNEGFNLDILLNAECKIVSSETTLTGGRVFLENLVKVVSAYAQDLLSGLHHPQTLNLESDLIHLKPNGYLHRLTWQKTKDYTEEAIEIDLTTVELFDLLEIIDQFLLDSSTLPDLGVPLEPLSRRHRQDGQPLVARTVPAFVGMATVALTAIAAFLIEPPVVREPQPQPLEGTTETIPLNESEDNPNPTTSP
ncbi:MAG: DUF4335 domain-containing protein [Gloeocapsa sp. DLM2.Bin57]|nr:MAG: DUF4335 domain-containing protein [Gloeocapsa sp. DLM2.Bin57]